MAAYTFIIALPQILGLDELDENAFQHVMQAIDEDIKKYQLQRKATHNQL